MDKKALDPQVKDKLIIGLQAAVVAVYILLTLKSSVKVKNPKMKKVMAKQAKRLDKLNRLDYRQQRKAMKKAAKGNAEA